jgi:Tfp pilus assembly protein PilV
MMISMLILTTGMLAIAALLGVTTQMRIGAREAARSMRLAHQKIDELMKEDFTTSDLISVGGSLTSNEADHFEAEPEGLEGITLRWSVAAGPVAETRVLTVRVENRRAQQYRNTEVNTIIRDE